MPNLDIRVATADDIPEILRQRGAMYEDIDCHDADLLAAMVSVSAGLLAKALADGSFRAWLASNGPRVVAGGAVVIVSP